MSVRARLVVTVLALLVLGLTAAGAGTYFAMRAFLINRIDDQLSGTAVFAVPEILADLREPGPPSDWQPLETVKSNSMTPAFTELREADGTVIHSINLQDRALNLPDELPLAGAERTGAGKLISLADHRVLVAQQPSGHKVILGASLDGVHATLRQLVLIEVLVGAITLVTVALLAWRGIARGLRPLAEIADDAGAIGHGDRTRRVRHAGPRTEVGRLARALNSAFDARRSAEDRLRRFVADASHELRTPLTSIRGYAELFRRGASTRPADLATSMHRIEDEATRMGDLVDELLLLARLDQGRPLERQPVDLAELAACAVADARAAEPQRPITLTAEEIPPVTGDANRLRQVVTNLLANVAEHTPADAAVTVRLTHESGRVRIEVSDSGPGLDAEQREHVFERFYRTDAARTGGGSGLGLSIVAAIAQSHGGSAGVRSEPEQGATFWVSVPAELTAISQVGHSDLPARDGGLEQATTPSAREENGVMTRLSRFVLDHKLLVAGFWLALLVAGMFASSIVPDRLSQQFSFPGQAGYEANQEILERYNGTGGPGDPLVPVVTLPQGTTAPDARQELASAFAEINSHPRLRAVSYPSTGDDAFIGNDGRTVFGLVFGPFTGESAGPDLAPNVHDALTGALPEGATVRVTGLGELRAQAAESGGGSGVLVETLTAAAGALIVLALVFGSLLSLVPLLVAAVSILSTFLAVLGLTTFTDVSFVVQFLVALIGLGVAIDYSLLLVTRWREERTAGRDRHGAVHAAMATAGRSVVFSGLTVAIALLVLVVVPVPFIRSVGYAGVLIPAISVLVTLTLLPVLLATSGPRLDWPRLRTERGAGRAWTRWATGVVRHRWVATAAALLLLAPLIVATFSLRLGNAPSEALPAQGPAREAVSTLDESRVPDGVLTPIEVLVPAGDDPAAVADTLDNVDGVYAAVVSDAGSGSGLVQVLPRAETSTDAGRDTVERVRDTVAAQFPDAAVGGSGALQIDAIDAIYGAFAWVLALIAVATFVLLARAFRSLVLAAQAVLVNLLSIAAAYGAAVLIWQQGYGSELIFGYEALGAVTFWVPLMTFAFLYGLSMDYEVFLLSRMRETYDETGSTSAAVVQGLGRVGRLVTSAALILFLAFVSLSAVPAVDVKVMATTLGVGILLDATILRTLLVPALVALSGRWTWWLPTWAAKVLRVAPSPPAVRQDARVS